MLVGLKYGLGKLHLAELSMNQLETCLKLLYSLQILWTATMPCVRWSLLFFYVRLFPVKQLRLACWAVGIFMAVFLIACEFVIIFQCSPTEYTWNRLIPNGHCINLTNFYIAASVLNMLTDIVTLVLPLGVIWGLQIDTRKKVALSVAFTIGGFVCIVSIVRIQLLASLNPSDPTWSQVYPGIWTCVESSIGVVVACIPSFTPIILSCIRGRMSATEVVIGYIRNHGTVDTFEEKGDVIDPGRMAAFNSSDETAVAGIRSESAARVEAELCRNSSGESYDHDELPLNGIFVTNEVKMTREERTRRAPRTPTRERSRSKAHHASRA
ncbi:MAG: hypothetical protein Q9157_007943 [Trypethelium eluteriae]